MSRSVQSPVNVDWTPEWVRALDVDSGRTAEAETLEGVGELFQGRRDVLIGVGPGLVFLKTVRLPKAAPDDLRRIIGVQLGQLFPLPADQLAFDFLQTDDRDAGGYLTIVAAMRADDVRRVRLAAKSAGLNGVRVLPMSLAAPAVAGKAGLISALVIEDVPAGLALDVVQEGVLRFSRSAPKDADPEAEARRTLTAARAPDLPILAIGSVLVEHAASGPSSTLSALHEAPSFNFELAEERAVVARRRESVRKNLAAVLLAGAIVMVLGVSMIRQSAGTRVQQAQARWLRRLESDRADRDKVRAEANTLQTTVGDLKTAFEPAQTLPDILAVVADSLPKSAWLNSISVARGKTMEIHGTASAVTDVAIFTSRLQANRRFRNITIVYANSGSTAKNTTVLFEIRATCVGNLPLVTPSLESGGDDSSADSGGEGQ